MMKIFIFILLVASLCNCLPQTNIIGQRSSNESPENEENGTQFKSENTTELRRVIGELSRLHKNQEKRGPQSVPDGYEYYPGFGYYKFYPWHEAFVKASTTCVEDGAHLVILNSDEEYEVVKKIYAKFPDIVEYAYVGFHDVYEEGRYVTIFNDPLEQTGFYKWKDGEPNNENGDEDCGAVHRTDGLHSLTCWFKSYPFICEIEE